MQQRCNLFMAGMQMDFDPTRRSRQEVVQNWFLKTFLCNLLVIVFVYGSYEKGHFVSLAHRGPSVLAVCPEDRGQSTS